MVATSKAPKGATHVLVNKDGRFRHIPSGMHWNKKTGKVHFSGGAFPGWTTGNHSEQWINSMGYLVKPVNLDLENK